MRDLIYGLTFAGGLVGGWLSSGASGVCSADVNADGVVNLVDGLLVRGRNGAVVAEQPAAARCDVNGDGLVDRVDFECVKVVAAGCKAYECPACE